MGAPPEFEAGRFYRPRHPSHLPFPPRSFLPSDGGDRGPETTLQEPFNHGIVLDYAFAGGVHAQTSAKSRFIPRVRVACCDDCRGHLRDPPSKRRGKAVRVLSVVHCLASYFFCAPPDCRIRFTTDISEFARSRSADSPHGRITTALECTLADVRPILTRIDTHS